MAFHSACSRLSSSAVLIQSVDVTSVSALAHRASFRFRFSARCSACSEKYSLHRLRTSSLAALKRFHNASA